MTTNQYLLTAEQLEANIKRLRADAEKMLEQLRDARAALREHRLNNSFGGK